MYLSKGGSLEGLIIIKNLTLGDCFRAFDIQVLLTMSTHQPPPSKKRRLEQHKKPLIGPDQIRQVLRDQSETNLSTVIEGASSNEELCSPKLTSVGIFSAESN
jgi:hypothetical protein